MKPIIPFLLIANMLCISITQAEYSGCVFIDMNHNGIKECKEKPVAGVMVSDGLNVVKTNSSGQYTLPGHQRERFIFITIPAGTKAHPFYKKIKKGHLQYDFALILNTKEEGSNHHFLHITDTEIFNTDNHQTWVNSLRNYAKNTGASFIIHTGDICYEKGMKEHIKLMNTDNFPCPVYYCIGNHDLIRGKYGEEVFESIYGPVFYSFDAGNTHYIVTPMLRGDYKPSYSQKEVAAWLKNDLAHIHPDQSIVVFSHDLLTTGKSFRYSDVNLNKHHLKAWIYGHRHNNHIRRQGDIFTICTGAVNKGGIDHSSAAFRDIRINTKGELSSSIRYVYLNKALCIASIQNGKTPLISNSYLPVSVNTYHADYPTKNVNCTLFLDGEKIYNTTLKAHTDWNWFASIPLPSDKIIRKKLRLHIQADFGPAGVRETEREFICTEPKTISVKPGKNWSNLLGNPEHSGNISSAPSPPYELAWLTNVGGNIYMSSPLTFKSMVIVASMDEDMKQRAAIHGLDSVTGRIRWSYSTRNSIKNTIALDGDTVLAQDTDGWLYALNAETGQLRWEKKLSVLPIPGLIDGLVVHQGIVYAGSGKGLTACSVQDGSTLWTNNAWKQREGTTSTLTLGGGILIASAQWQALYAHDAATGKLLWKNAAHGLRNRGASASIHGEYVYITSLASLFIIELRSGKILKREQLPVPVESTSTPLVTDTEIIFGTSKDGLLALDKTTLKEKWRYSSGDALIYNVPYTTKPSRTIESSPIQVGASILITASDGSFTAIDRKTGRPIWQAKTGSPILSTPAVSGNTVFVADFSGNVYAFTHLNKR